MRRPRTSPPPSRTARSRSATEHGLPLVRFPLEETAAAHDAVENGAVGKVLIDVADLD